MIGDMIVRIEDILLNLGEIACITNMGETSEAKTLGIRFKSGFTKKIELKNKSYENLMEYYNALCPDLNDDYTRKMMVQHIINQRTQLIQKMINEGQLPKTDFPNQMGKRPEIKGPQ